MAKINVEIFEDVVSVIDRIRESSDSNIELYIPDGAAIFDNGLNLRLILRDATALNKKVSFSTPDVNGKHLISLIEEGERPVDLHSEHDFVSREISFDELVGGSPDKSQQKSKSSGPKLPKLSLSLPTFTFLSNFKLPRFGNSHLFGIVGGVLFAGLIILGGYFAIWKTQKAEINIVVNSQPLVKSIQVQVAQDGKNNADARTLEGRVFATTLTETVKTDTTGKKIIGEKAKGKIEIRNLTTTKKNLDKGEELISKDDDDLSYFLRKEIEVPAGQVDNCPTFPIGCDFLPGVVEADVDAEKIGKDYNLDKGDDLEFDDYSKNELTAEVKEGGISGGKSEEVRVVTQADLDKLAVDIAKIFKEKSPNALKTSVPSGWVMISGSEAGTSISKKFNYKVDEVADQVELTESMNYQGLGYSFQALEGLLNELLKEFVPDEFELSKESKDMNVEILGNTEKTALSLAKADLQVTLKSFIVPIINADEIKSQLVGISIPEAERVLSNVRNVENYQIVLNPSIPLLNFLPRNVDNLNVSVTRK